MGCSGAPVIDEYGRLAAVNVGHLLNQSIPGKKQLLCIATADILNAIKLPSDVHPIKDASAPPPLGNSQELANQQADTALRSAKLFFDNQMYDKARQKLEDIIKVYPITEAAKKARAMLLEIPNQ